MIRGSIVALVTPMHDDGRIDFDALAGLVEWHVNEGTDAIVAVGTTGESATLTVPEHVSVIECVVKAAAGRVPVIAGTGANATDEAIELTRAGQRAGAAACLSVTPYYNKPPQEGLYRHFRAIAEAVEIPLILYNVPGRTGCDMQPETVQRLVEVRNVVGLKEAKGDLQRIRELLAIRPRGFALYSGDDATACESMLLGCDGDISVTANVAPAKMHALCAAALAGDRARAERIDAEIGVLHRALFVDPNPIPAKWALHTLGRIPGGLRLPLVPLAARHQPTVAQALRTSGVMT